METKAITLTAKQENKGAKAIIELTSTLGQTLKQFGGLYKRILPDTDGLTTEDWMYSHGVCRFVTPAGKVKGYTPGLLMQGWHAGMQKEGVAHTFKSVPATWIDPDTNEKFFVYSHKEAHKAEGRPTPLRRKMLVPISQNGWSVKIIIRGLQQSAKFDKENAKMIESDLAWEETATCYIIREMVDENGNVTRTPQVVAKDEVVF